MAEKKNTSPKNKNTSPKNKKKIVAKAKTAAAKQADGGDQLAATETVQSPAEGQEAAIVQPETQQAESQPDFPIVGIGGSAGSLESLTELFGALPASPQMAFVVVQHLDPAHESVLDELLARKTSMTVEQVRDGMRVKANAVYVIPPDRELQIKGAALRLSERKTSHMPVDTFLRSLADDQKERSVAVILSGTGTDGSLGVRAIKDAGGITFAQDEDSARYPDMPNKADETGSVDLRLTPKAIAQQLVEIGRHTYITQPSAALELPTTSEEAKRKLFLMLRARFGVDFNLYAPQTINRRIARRMAVRHAERLDGYVKYVETHPEEIEQLFNDLLICVTSFFRDPRVFDYLKEKILPRLLPTRGEEKPLRIWIAGCATGEEAYSIGICLLELLGDNAADFPIQIFATDLNESWLESARAGTYAESIANDVTPERLRRFFEKTARGYQVSKVLRDMCIFARHNVLKDPPFSRMDLISCRNLLIYLNPTAQKRVMSSLHYALIPNGFLLLGSSESVGDKTTWFSQVDRHFKVFGKKLASGQMQPDLAVGEHEFVEGPILPSAARLLAHERPAAGLQFEVDKLILTRFSPAGVVINDDFDILQFRGRVGPYVEPAPGRASLNLMKMAKEGLAAPVKKAVLQAKREHQAIHKGGIRVKTNGASREIDIEVLPVSLPSHAQAHFLVLFRESSVEEANPAAKEHGMSKAAAGELERLRSELTLTREHMQSIIEDQEATNEELNAANEELQSANEELQSTNEELQTAKEELQSTNEELSTVNEELLARNEEQANLYNDMNNLLASVNIPIIMVSSDLRIRRATPAAEKLLNIIPSDIGRPISNIRANLDVGNLDVVIRNVMDTLRVDERQVHDKEGREYLMRTGPYRTSENRIDGAVLVLFDHPAWQAAPPQTNQAPESPRTQ